MKRILLMLSFVMCCVVSLFAKADVTLKSGSLSNLKTSKAKVFVVWDYSHATLEGKGVKAFLISLTTCSANSRYVSIRRFSLP